MAIKKYILNGLFLIALMIGTLYFVLKDQEIDQLFVYISQAKATWLLCGLVFVLVFIMFESVIIHYLMKSLSCTIKLIHCIKYSFIGFFVSAITPSATGGQPAQMYYMKADGLSMTMSSLVLMVVTVAYKAVLMILAVIMLLCNRDFVMGHLEGIEFITVFGIIVNVVIISFLLLLIFRQSFAKKIVGNTLIWLGRHHLIKNYQHKVKNVLSAMSKYNKSSDFLKSNKRIIFNVLIITTVQRLALFAVTWTVYKSFGLTGFSCFEIITLQLIISLAVDNLPLPGGMGASEGIFLLFFEEIFSVKYITAGLLISRGLNYYAIIILGGVITAIAQLTRKKRMMELKK